MMLVVVTIVFAVIVAMVVVVVSVCYCIGVVGSPLVVPSVIPSAVVVVVGHVAFSLVPGQLEHRFTGHDESLAYWRLVGFHLSEII